MPTFVLRLIAPRPNFAQTMTEAEREIMNRHAAHWRPYLERGNMVVFGPILTDDDSYGLAVVETDDEQALRDFAAQDLVVTTGTAAFELGRHGRRASLGHRDLATHPGVGLLDRVARPWVFRPSRLEQVKDVLRARCRPQGEELVIRIGEGATAADRYETRAAVFREDHTAHLLLASVQHVTHAPRVSNRQVRARSDRTAATSAVHRGTGRADPRADRRGRLPGAIHYSRDGSPQAAVVAAVGAAQVKNGECGRRRRGRGVCASHRVRAFDVFSSAA